MNVVVISGPPASGKSTLGRRLALDLSVAYLARDDFKVGVYKAVATARLDSGVAGRASGEAWLAAVAAFVDEGAPVLADGVFNHPQDVERFRSFARERRLACYELRLVCTETTALERFANRNDPPLTEAIAATVETAVRTMPERIVPDALDALVVDTNDFGAVDYPTVRARVARWVGPALR
ncbi:MAG: hypothetical protein QOI20_557 [Acidimicrobiaceae bacterium]|jgi:predicted kinase|nr:hypothetical protein [Acidimicrobiaceae bacterium]